MKFWNKARVITSLLLGVTLTSVVAVGCGGTQDEHTHTPVTVTGKGATCSEAGLTDGTKCSECGEILTAQQPIEKLAHTPVPVEGKDATCKEEGLTAGEKCSVCEEILTAQEPIEKLPHTKEPLEEEVGTCQETGKTAGEWCSVCETVLVEQQDTGYGSHDYGKDDKCTVCGEENPDKPKQAFLGTDVRYPNALWSAPAFAYEPSLDIGAGDTEGVKGLFFDSVEYKGKKTKVAAYIGFPDGVDINSDTAKVPAIVLVHGAGGTAVPEWVRYWNELGFAAISIDLEGAEPTEGVCNAKNDLHLARNRYNNGALDPDYTAGPSNMAVGDGLEAIENQWLYHASSAVIAANSLIRSFACVDGLQVGVTGISWGSVVTSVAVAYDGRFNFAMPVYGGVSVAESCSSFENMFEAPYQNADGTFKSEQHRQASEAMKARWDTLDGLKQTSCKVYYITSTTDFAFSMDIASRCAQAANGTSNFKPEFTHGQAQGATEPSLPEFAKHALGNNEVDFVEITKNPTATDANITFKTYGNAKVSAIKVYYSNSERPGPNAVWAVASGARLKDGETAYALSVPASKWAFVMVEYNDGARSVTSYLFEGPTADIVAPGPETTGTFNIADDFKPTNTQTGEGVAVKDSHVFEYDNVTNTNKYGLLNYEQCLLPAPVMDHYMEADDGWITYKLEATEGNALKALKLDLSCFYGHGGGLYWYNSSRQNGKDTLGANLYVEISSDNQEFTRVYDMNEANGKYIQKNEKGKLAPEIDLSDYAYGKKTLYVRIYMMHMTREELNFLNPSVSTEAGIIYNRFGVGIYSVSLSGDYMAE